MNNIISCTRQCSLTTSTHRERACASGGDSVFSECPYGVVKYCAIGVVLYNVVGCRLCCVGCDCLVLMLLVLVFLLLLLLLLLLEK